MASQKEWEQRTIFTYLSSSGALFIEAAGVPPFRLRIQERFRCRRG